MPPHLCNPWRFFVFVLLAAGCANQIPPEGGPADERGPVIVATSPAPFGVNFRGDEIEFVFDEYIDQRSFEESVFISPSIHDYEFDWSGHSVTIKFLEPLKISTTYVLTVGTDVVDLEPSRRNRMERAFTFAFSTGPQIDRGLLDGRVFGSTADEDPSGVMVFAYDITGGRRDTLNPQWTLPDYVTQTGKDGTFRLPHIRLGSYALIALRDEYRNTLYEREIDAYAVQSGPVVITPRDTASTGIILQLAREDTSGPRLIKVDATDRNHVALTFSEEIDTTAGRSLMVSAVDTATNKSVIVFAVLPSLADAKSFTAVTEYLTARSGYRLSVSRVFDRAGNHGLPGTLVQSFAGPERLDTLRPKVLSVTPKDSTREIAPPTPVTITFSEPMQMNSYSGGELKFLAHGGGSIKASARWVTQAVLEISPINELQPLTWYSISIPVAGLMDWKNSLLTDSVVVARFATADPENEGSIEGVVSDPSVRDTSGAIVVEAVGLSKVGKKTETLADKSGRFVLRSLAPGQFVVTAFRDRNGNGRFDAGRPWPYEPSERRSDVSDSLRVRPRWPLEGVRVTLPR